MCLQSLVHDEEGFFFLSFFLLFFLFFKFLKVPVILCGSYKINDVSVFKTELKKKNDTLFHAVSYTHLTLPTSSTV